METNNSTQETEELLFDNLERKNRLNQSEVGPNAYFTTQSLTLEACPRPLIAAKYVPVGTDRPWLSVKSQRHCRCVVADPDLMTAP